MHGPTEYTSRQATLQSVVLYYPSQEVLATSTLPEALRKIVSLSRDGYNIVGCLDNHGLTWELLRQFAAELADLTDTTAFALEMALNRVCAAD